MAARHYILAFVIACTSCSKKVDTLSPSGEEASPSSPLLSQEEPPKPTHQGITFVDDDSLDAIPATVLPQASHPAISDDVLRRAAIAGAKRLDSESSNNGEDGHELTLKSSMADSVIEILGMDGEKNGESQLDVEVNVRVGEGADDLNVSEFGVSKGNVSATFSDEEEVRVQWKVDF